MANVFESRKIVINNSLWKATLERITDWRKGIAVARYFFNSIKPSWKYFLIDKDYNYLYEKSSWHEDEIEGEQIERVFGGCYIVKDVKLDDCRTFPGQDRDTEYYYSTCVKAVLDENGKVLSKEEMNNFLKQNPIKQTTDYGEGIVECESSFYRLDTYQYLFKIPKTLKPLEYYKDGRCRVSIVSDYRDFYVVVKDKIINAVYDEKQFAFIEKLLGIDIIGKEIYEYEFLKQREKFNKQNYIQYSPVYKGPEETIAIKKIEPEVKVEICNYLSTLGDLYKISGHLNFVHDEIYGINRNIFEPHTCYYYVDDEWRMIEGNEAKKLYNKILEQNINRPNYIQDIEHIAEEVVLQNEVYSIFRFKCRPFGFITDDGKFEYDFDVNNIQW